MEIASVFLMRTILPFPIISLFQLGVDRQSSENFGEAVIVAGGSAFLQILIPRHHYPAGRRSHCTERSLIDSFTNCKPGVSVKFE